MNSPFSNQSHAAFQTALIRAEQFIQAGNFQDALALLTSNAPSPSLLLSQGALVASRDFMIGRCYLELKQAQAALEPLSRAVRQQKSNASYRIAYGAALHLTNNLPEAEKNYREAMRLVPAAENPPFNLARVLAERGDVDGALRAYQLAISRNPRYTMAIAALADLQIVRGNLAEAQTLVQKALALDPKLAFAWNCYGKLVERAGKFDEAAAHYQKAIEFDSTLAESWYNAGRMQMHFNALKLAEDFFSRAEELEPRNEQYRFMHSMARQTLGAHLTTGEGPRVPDSTVKQLFDQYAETFDQSLVKELHYKTPQLLYELLAPALAEHKGGTTLAAIDLGCGTGLMGPLVCPYCATLVGVDLSPKMLEKAKRRGYTKLIAGEISGFLQGEMVLSIDLVLAADVFVYIGDLNTIFEQLKRIIRPNGLFAFSIESLDAYSATNAVIGSTAPDSSASYWLLPSQRFAHRVGYIEQLALNTAFEIVSSCASALRTEAGKPIMGTLFVLRKR